MKSPLIIRQRWKAIAAFLSLLAGWLSTALVDGHISSAEYAGLAVVVLGTFGVYQVKNDQ